MESISIEKSVHNSPIKILSSINDELPKYRFIEKEYNRLYDLQLSLSSTVQECKKRVTNSETQIDNMKKIYEYKSFSRECEEKLKGPLKELEIRKTEYETKLASFDKCKADFDIIYLSYNTMKNNYKVLLDIISFHLEDMSSNELTIFVSYKLNELRYQELQGELKHLMTRLDNLENKVYGSVYH